MFRGVGISARSGLTLKRTCRQFRELSLLVFAVQEFVGSLGLRFGACGWSLGRGLVVSELGAKHVTSKLRTLDPTTQSHGTTKTKHPEIQTPKRRRFAPPREAPLGADMRSASPWRKG